MSSATARIRSGSPGVLRKTPQSIITRVGLAFDPSWKVSRKQSPRPWQYMRMVTRGDDVAGRSWRCAFAFVALPLGFAASASGLVASGLALVPDAFRADFLAMVDSSA